MSFREGLERIGENVDDCIGAALFDKDGILVEEYKVDPLFDLNPIVAEYSAFLKAADKASTGAEVGLSQEITVSTEKAVIIMRRMIEGYFLVLVMQSEKNIGKGRFWMKREAALLVSEL